MKVIEVSILYKKFSVRTCLSPQSGARVLERLPCLKYYNVLKWENRLNWILNNFYLNFFSYNPYFWQRWSLKSVYYPVSIHYNIWNVAIFRAHKLHSRVRNTSAPTEFFVGNWILNNIYFSFLNYNQYFGHYWTQKSIYFHVSVYYNISNMGIFQTP